MFDVGFAEIFLLGLIGLLVLGPERLPAVARTLGGFMRKARASWASLRSTIESELAEADIAAPIKEASEELKRIGKDIKSDLPDMNKILDPNPKPSKLLTDVESTENAVNQTAKDSSDTSTAKPKPSSNSNA
jgi:sec-independent protein translocase protein TatB